MIRLPSVTIGVVRRNIGAPIALAVACAVLIAAAYAASAPQAGSALVPPSLAEELGPAMSAIRVPHAWLAAGPPRLRRGDRVDVIASRGGDAAGVVRVLGDVRVLEIAEDAVVVEASAEDIATLALARAGAYLFLLSLRALE